MSTDDTDITPTTVSDDLEKYRRAYSAILDGKVETRLHRMKFGGVETAAIVVSRPVGKDRERIIPLFVAVSPNILEQMTTMWGEPVARPKAPVREEPKMVADADEDELADDDG